MAKIGEIQEISITKLKPNKRNAKKHGDDQIKQIADSIQAFGFLSPCLIDKQMNLIAGHGRVMAAKSLGMETIPCLFVEGLTDEQREAYTLADNRLTELGEWDFDLVFDVLTDLNAEDFDVKVTGFDVDLGGDFFEEREKFESDEGQSEEYNEFVDKFKLKKTTDDCYTPEPIFEIIADWVAKEYNLDQKKFMRPFYPGGDFERETYPEGCVVVDNPPFSIESKILRFYVDKGIKFFLFNPSLTGITPFVVENLTFISCGASITYENGAKVSTSFITNLDDPTILLRTVPSLRKEIESKDKEIQKENKRELSRNSYPDQVLTAAMSQYYAAHDTEFVLHRYDAVSIDALDEQKEQGQAIYGRGLLLSEKAAAEKAAAEKAAATKWCLSDREWSIVKSLGGE